LHRGDDLIDADAVRGKLPRIDVDADGVFLRPEYIDLRDPIHRGDTLRDVRIGVFVDRRAEASASASRAASPDNHQGSLKCDGAGICAGSCRVAWRSSSARPCSGVDVAAQIGWA
jgi:hypothetical protein